MHLEALLLSHPRSMRQRPAGRARARGRGWAAFALLVRLLAPMAGWAAEPTRSACPSLGGEWSGHFGGHASGTWGARFSESKGTLSAAATIVVGHGQLTATGTARVTCSHGIVSIDGTGQARGVPGRFTGVADAQGRSLHGTWSGGRLHGTWDGSR
jgi:hypothetical protein